MTIPGGRAGRAVAVVVAALIGVNLALLALKRTTRGPSGPPSSSYATAPEGIAAYADLLARSGHPVVRARDPLAELRLDPIATVILLEPDHVSRGEARRLRRFVERGGQLVTGGANPGPWLDVLLESEPAWSPSGATRAAPIAPAPEVAGVDEAAAAGEGSWDDVGEALPVLGSGSTTLVAVARSGRGSAALLADASPLQNRLLGTLDNAALGLALAGERGRPVVFVESVHGYGEVSGLRAVPTAWRWALGGLVAAALVFMWARGRRLGPPEAEERELPPARKEYVEALAAVLAKTRDAPAAIEPVRAAARERLARRAGLDAGAGPDGVRKAAARLGLTREEAEALANGGGDLLAAGRALARLERDGVA